MTLDRDTIRGSTTISMFPSIYVRDGSSRSDRSSFNLTCLFVYRNFVTRVKVFFLTGTSRVLGITLTLIKNEFPGLFRL